MPAFALHNALPIALQNPFAIPLELSHIIIYWREAILAHKAFRVYTLRVDESLLMDFYCFHFEGVLISLLSINLYLELHRRTLFIAVVGSSVEIY